MDQSEDVLAAQEALKNPSGLNKQGCDELDPYVDAVFQEWKQNPTHIHANLGVARNCKAEAGLMIDEARRRMNDVNVANAAMAASYANTGWALLQALPR